MIGIVGYGMVGKAVANAFYKEDTIISDPSYNHTTVEDICKQTPKAIFVCVPTPTDGTEYAILKDVLQRIKLSGYSGLTVVKSTVLPRHLDGYDVLYNPEFLSRATSFEDFRCPQVLVIGGTRAAELLSLYKHSSTMQIDNSKIFLVDINTAAMIKYTMNTFYALKVTFMNEIYDVSKTVGADYQKMIEVLAHHSWMGSNHFQVPGPDGLRGFGGPCLPKDTEALATEFDMKLLNTVLDLNEKYRR